MAALQFSLWHTLRSLKPSQDGTKRAREFADRAFKTTNGPTPELRKVYQAYLDNERRRKQQRSQPQ